MKISFGTNIDALRAGRNIAETSNQLGRTFEALSSGSRINSGADLAIAANLKASTRIASVAIRNTNDGISQVSYATEGISEIISILGRMLELAQQSSNGTYSNSQHNALATEYVQLASEADRTAGAIQFNGQPLLSNSRDVYVQVGLEGAVANNTIIIPRTLATLESVGLRDTFGQLTVSISATTADFSVSSSRAAIPVIQDAIETLTQRRSTLAAAENRLHHAVEYQSSNREQLEAANSRITDVDVASETASLVRLQILLHAQTSIAAQANQNTSTVLELLKVRG